MTDKHIVRRTDGGFFQVSNRWIDAGFMQSAPGSVTQVYLHLCRWADNTSHEAAQPMKLMAKKCGLSVDVARKAVRVLERWNVIQKEDEPNEHGVNVWILLALPTKAPPYPAESSPSKQSRKSDESEGVVKSGGPLQSGGSEKSDPQKSLGLNQTDSYQTEEISDKDAADADGDAMSATDDVQSDGQEKPTPFQLGAAIFEAAGVDIGMLGGREKGKQLAAAKRMVDDGVTVQDGVAVAKWLLADPFWRDKGVDVFRVESKRVEYLTANATKGQPAVDPKQQAADDQIRSKVARNFFNASNLEDITWMTDHRLSKAQYDALASGADYREVCTPEQVDLIDNAFRAKVRNTKSISLYA